MSISRIPVALCALAVARAVGAAEPTHHETLEAVVVTATPLATNALESAQPISVVTGEDLVRKVSSSLGETVSGEPGVSSTFYGPVASRPVIRGLGGYRVQMLDDGISSMDASTLSEDHAVTIESALADRIEILRGPSALLYGSGGSGGVVNVVNGRLPDEAPDEPFDLRAEVRGDTALDEKTGVAAIGGRIGGLFVRVDGYSRETDDISIPGDQTSKRLREQLEASGGEILEGHGTVPNTASDSSGVGAGVSWFGDRGSIGVSANRFDSNYGLAPEEEAFIDMEEDRYDLKARLEFDGDRLQALKVRAGYVDYTHTEFEGPGEPGTVFFNTQYDTRASLDHSFGEGWRGTAGVQYGHQDFEAVGEEAFVPPSITETLGLFGVEARDLGDWTVEGGLRYDNQQITSESGTGLPDYDEDAFNLSLGVVRRFAEDKALAVNVTRTERHPQATELYADGFHAALGRIEVGDATLGKETGYTLDVALRSSGTSIRQWNIGMFYNRYQDYIFIAPTGAIDPDEGVPIYAYQQEDTDLYGFEAQLGIPVAAVETGDLTVLLKGDYVRGKVKDGDDLPAMPPYRLGLGLDYDLERLHLGMDATWYGKQDKVAANELPTDGYTLLSIDASYRWQVGQGMLFAFLSGTNLLDDEARQATSPLKDIVPLPGRGVRMGVRLEF